MNQSNKPLTQQEREARAQYFREWRAKNKDKVRIYNQNYWRKRASLQAKEDENNG